MGLNGNEKAGTSVRCAGLAVFVTGAYWLRHRIYSDFRNLDFKNGAVEKTRTSTGLPPQRPQRCASTVPPRPHTLQYIRYSPSWQSLFFKTALG